MFNSMPSILYRPSDKFIVLLDLISTDSTINLSTDEVYGRSEIGYEQELPWVDQMILCSFLASYVLMKCLLYRPVRTYRGKEGEERRVWMKEGEEEHIDKVS